MSNKTAYAEEVQVRGESMELKKNAKKANDGENVSGTSGHVEPGCGEEKWFAELLPLAIGVGRRRHNALKKC